MWGGTTRRRHVGRTPRPLGRPRTHLPSGVARGRARREEGAVAEAVWTSDAAPHPPEGDRGGTGRRRPATDHARDVRCRGMSWPRRRQARTMRRDREPEPSATDGFATTLAAEHRRVHTLDLNPIFCPTAPRSARRSTRSARVAGTTTTTPPTTRWRSAAEVWDALLEDRCPRHRRPGTPRATRRRAPCWGHRLDVALLAQAAKAP